MKMNKKAQMVSSILMLSIAIILVGYLFIPQVQQSGSFSATQSIVKVNASNNETFSLTNFPVLTLSFSPALTETTNYTLNTETGSLQLLAGKSLNQTYTASYTYEGGRYIDSASDRALFFVLITVVIAGLLYKGAEMFGMV